MSLDTGKTEEDSRERIKITYHTPYGDCDTIKEATSLVNKHLPFGFNDSYTEYQVLMYCRKDEGLGFSQTVEGIKNINADFYSNIYGNNRVSTGSLPSSKQILVKGNGNEEDSLQIILNNT